MKNTTGKELKEARGEMNRLRELFYSTKFEAGAMSPTAQQRYFVAYLPFDTSEFKRYVILRYNYIFLLCDKDPVQALDKWGEWVNNFIRDSELMRCEFYDKVPGKGVLDNSKGRHKAKGPCEASKGLEVPTLMDPPC